MRLTLDTTRWRDSSCHVFAFALVAVLSVANCEKRPASPGPPPHQPRTAIIATKLPACAEPPCGRLCEASTRRKLYVEQASALEDAEADCLTCVVNAVAACNEAMFSAHEAECVSLVARASDLLRLPVAVVAGSQPTQLTTQPIGLVDEIAVAR